MSACLPAGKAGGRSGSFNGSSSTTSISFSSSCIDFSSATQEDRSIALDAITPSLSIAPDGLLNSFTAQATGDFGVSFTAEPNTGLVFGVTVLGLICMRPINGGRRLRPS